MPDCLQTAKIIRAEDDFSPRACYAEAMQKVFVGFGFGAIQGGLFLYEAFRSANFGRLVVAEVQPEIVRALRRAQGRYMVNVATATAIEQNAVAGVEVFNPAEASDRAALIEAIAQADEIATALPSVDFYSRGAPQQSVAALIAAGLRQSAGRRTVIYAAENHNQAAERLAASILAQGSIAADALGARAQFLNTVIGKMSGLVQDAAQIRQQNLAPLTEDLPRCLLVETFNRILISRITWPDFQRGIAVFEEKDQLLPFEEAKLFGHNATHALLGYLARLQGYAFMADLRQDSALLALGRAAFLEESGRALCARHRGFDPLFTPAGYQAYADDLLERMLNPFLQDAVARVVRDPRRKLGWDDRLLGTMRLAWQEGIEPWRYARGARAALRMLEEEEHAQPEELLQALLSQAPAEAELAQALQSLILKSQL